MADKRSALKINSFESFMAILFLNGGDQGRYGCMIDFYQIEYANKCGRYPKGVYDIMDVMRQRNPKKPSIPPEKKRRTTRTMKKR